MGKQAILAIAKKWNGETEYRAAFLPPGEYQSLYRSPITLDVATHHFNMGLPVYVKGLRVVRYA